MLSVYCERQFKLRTPFDKVWMKVLIVAVLLIVKQISPVHTKSTNSLCNQNNDGSIFPDPDSCDRFIHCHQSGKAAVKRCPIGTRFDRTVNACNFKQLVPCNKISNPQIVPSKPRSLAATAVNSTTIQILWTEPSRYSKPLNNYVILVTRSGSASSIQYTVDPTILSLMVTGLLPGSKFTVEIRAANSVGIGKPATRVVTTPFDIPPPPVILSAKGLGPTAISLRWKDPKLSNDSILNYIVTYGIAGLQIGQLSQRFHGYSKTAVITNLYPGTEYEFKVQALTFRGFGAPGIVRVWTTTGDQCPRGFHSKTGKNPCHRCMYGSYQQAIGRKTCSKCQHGTTTLFRGATSKRQCVKVIID